MTKAAAIYEFWSNFGLTAYEENSVPSDAQMPYITYQFVSDSFGNDVAMTASAWYRSTSWVEANRKADEISRYIEIMSEPIKIDEGRMWVKKGTPFCQSMGDDSDELIKRKYFNLVVEFFTPF